MYTNYIKTISSQLANLPVSNGQIIATSNEPGWYYDMNNVRYRVDAPGCYHGVCDGQASSQVKIVTLSGISGFSFSLKVGVSIAIKFSADNMYSATVANPVKLNVNNTGDRPIYAGGTSTPTGTNTIYFGKAGNINFYIYDGTYWIWAGSNTDTDGHTILDASGNALNQREDLEFGGYLKSSDDSTNSRTVVSDAPTEVTWATWQTMTAEQKAGTKWVITGAPYEESISAENVVVTTTNTDLIATDAQDAFEEIGYRIPYYVQDIAAWKNGLGNRGKDITSYWKDGTLSDRIAGRNGFKPFDDIFLWDYITLDSNVRAYNGTGTNAGTKEIRIIELNPYNNYQLNNRSDSVNFFNHVAMCPTTHFGTSYMNSANTTVGGYIGSVMYRSVVGNINVYASMSSFPETPASEYLYDDFYATDTGSVYRWDTASTQYVQLSSTEYSICTQLYLQLGSMLKPIKHILTTSINASGYNRLGSNGGCSNNWAWQPDRHAVLMSEMEVYGGTIWSSSGYDTGNAEKQFAAFSNDQRAMFPQGIYYWLKDVASSTHFACAYGYNGHADYISASGVIYVRPCFIIA